MGGDSRPTIYGECYLPYGLSFDEITRFYEQPNVIYGADVYIRTQMIGTNKYACEGYLDAGEEIQINAKQWSACNEIMVATTP